MYMKGYNNFENNEAHLVGLILCTVGVRERERGKKEYNGAEYWTATYTIHVHAMNVPKTTSMPLVGPCSDAQCTSLISMIKTEWITSFLQPISPVAQDIFCFILDVCTNPYKLQQIANLLQIKCKCFTRFLPDGFLIVLLYLKQS